MRARLAVFALLVSASGGATLADAPRARAARATAPVRVDGRLAEADWARAEAFSGFVQVFPREGGAPSEQNDVRVLYGAVPFYTAQPSGTDRLEPGGMAPAGRPPTDPDARTSAPVANAVLRWEYRPGATLYAVYARSQTELPFAEGAAPHALAPRGLGLGPTTDAFLLKWSYRLAR